LNAVSRGAFAAGGRIVMTPFGQEPIELRIAEAVEPAARSATTPM